MTGYSLQDIIKNVQVHIKLGIADILEMIDYGKTGLFTVKERKYIGKPKKRWIEQF